ncbi:MAG: molybdopterin-synthase adenylyltransferase MoeB [Silanimonas sp.]
MQGARAGGAVGNDIDVSDASALLAAGARLYDVREPEEQALGLPEGAMPLPLSQLETDVGLAPGSGAPVLLICAKGQRSQRAAVLLRERGIEDVRSLRGGLEAWRAARLPMAAVDMSVPAPSVLDADALERYDRHVRLAAVGAKGQQRLLASRVVIVGAGGLGSPAAFYLAAAGVGRLVLVDDDRVERSNLQRQILHVDAAVGTSKVASARERLRALNPRIAVDAIDARVTPDTVESLLRGADVVIDGSDNFATRYLVDAACLRLGLPLVYGAVERFTGQVSVFDAGRQRGRAPCYRCLFPEPPGADAAPNCAEAGVLGVLPGLVGLLQATEALKLLLGIGEPLVGRLLTIDALTMRFRELALDADADCPGCGAHARFDGYAAIETACASR